MKKILVSIFVLSSVSVCHAVTPSRWVDGVIENAWGSVSSTMAWSQTEYDQMVQKCEGGCEAVTYTPTSTELAISSNVYKFDNYSDYVECFTKEGIRKKIMAVIVVVPEFWTSMKAMGYPSNPKIDWMVSYYLSLP